MPVHDWIQVNAGLFDHFDQRWIGALGDALNAGLLPPGYFALAEQVTAGPIPDVATLRKPSARRGSDESSGGLAVTDAPPRAWAIRRAEEDAYAAKADRLAIHFGLAEVVAVIEIVSPGNKSSKGAFGQFVRKAGEFLRGGIHLLVIDLFPPGRLDPKGIHPAIWDEFAEEPFDPPPGKPLTVASYSVGEVKVAYVEPLGAGDPLPELPLFLTPSTYIPAPLETTYRTTWDVCPLPLRQAVEGR
jgi:hypothetical protein